MAQAATIVDEVDLDDILDQALDDLEQIDNAPELPQEPNKDETVPLSPSAPSTGLQMKQHEFSPFMSENEVGADSERDAQLLDQFMKQMMSAVDDSETKSSAKKAAPSPEKSPNRPATTEKNDNDTVEAALASILQQMTTMDPDEFDDDFLSAAGGLDPNAIVDGMMEQLLSKDLMYEPMKHVADHFPAWIEEKKESLSQAELAKYRRQHECFKELVDQYETDPSNTERLMKLMQDAQEFGQPPEEIIKAIAPGLELDGDGMPKINPLEGFGENSGDCAQM